AAVQQVERVRGTLQADRFRYAYLGRRLTLFEDLTTSLLAQPTADMGEIFTSLEHARSRALLDAVSGAIGALHPTAGSADSEEASLRSKADRARAELNALYSQLYDSSQTLDHKSVRDTRRAVLRA